MPEGSDPLADLAASLRALLQQMDIELVPQSLDKVLAHSGKRLTPPLTKRLFDELDSNEWLRRQMVEQLDDEDEQLATAFLERKPGWWRTLVQPAVKDEGRAEAAAIRADKTEKKLQEAKRRVKQLRQENDRLQSELRSLRSKATQPPPPASVAGPGVLEALEEELAGAVAERTRLQQRIDDLRRRRPERHPRAAGTSPTDRGFGRAGAAELGRRLDLEFAAMSTTPGAEVGDEAPPRNDGEDERVAARLRVPGGIPPDGAEAMEWLTRVHVPLHVIVDGYNVTFLIDPDGFRTGPVRRLLVEKLFTLRRRLPESATLEVVFDSAEGADSDPIITATGVGVRFTTTGTIADDEIVETVATTPQATVVISNDRELRMRAEAAGAVALWGDALVAWFR